LHLVSILFPHINEDARSKSHQILIVNCITNSCIWHPCVTWQGIDYKLPEDDKIVSKHVGVL